MSKKDKTPSIPLPINSGTVEPEKELLKYAKNYSWEEPLFKTLVEIAPIGITLSSSKRDLAYSNKAFASIVGYTQEELYGIDWGKLTHEEDRGANFETYQKLVKGEIDSFECKKRYWHKAGHLVWCKLKVTIVQDKQSGEKLTLALIQDITEEIQKSSLLDRQKAMNQLGEEVAGFGTFVWDIVTRELEVSWGMYRLFGMNPPEEDKKESFDKFFAHIHPEDLEMVVDAYNKFAETRISEPLEFRIITPEGKQKWVIPSTGKFISPTVRLSTLQDITEEKSKNTQLTRQNSMLEMGVQGAKLASFVWNSENLTILSNHGIWELYDFKTEEYTPKGLFEKIVSMTHPEDMETFQANLQKVVAGEASLQFEVRIMLDSGEIKWIRIFPCTSLSSEEKLATLQDITEDVLKSALLRQQSEFIEIGEKTAGMGTFIWDIETRELLASPGLYHLYELNPEDYHSKNLLEKMVLMTHPDDLEALQRNMSNISANKTPNPIEFRVKLESGEVKWLRTSEGKFLNDTEKLGTVQDVTQEKMKSMKLEQQSEKLIESQKEMEQLLYTVSHDLRAPLRHVSSYAQMLQLSTSQKLDERETKNLDNVLSASNRLGIMIDELLQFFRNKQVKLQEEAIDLSTITQSTQALFSADTEERGIVWSIGNLPIVNGDKYLIEKVMLNLLSNAVKFTSKTKHPHIEITAQEKEGMALIQVSDNGSGFKMKYIDKVFAVFQRLHKRSEFEGTGIGLATVKRIVQKHGGSIWAEGEVGKGANFYFTLPLYQETD